VSLVCKEVASDWISQAGTVLCHRPIWYLLISTFVTDGIMTQNCRSLTLQYRTTSVSFWSEWRGP